MSFSLKAIYSCLQCGPFVGKLAAKKCCLTVLLAMLIAVGPFAIAAESQSEPPPRKLSFDIAVQPASLALMSFAKRAGLALIFPQALVSSINTNKLQGTFTIEAGLTQLLSETGLSGKIYSGTTLVVTECKDGCSEKPASGEEQRAEIMKNKKLKGTLISSTTGLAATLLAAQVAAQDASADDTKQVQSLEKIVVTGVRGSPRTVTQSATPIDVIEGDKLASMLGTEPLRDVLSRLVPSFQSMNVASSSWNSVSRPAALRGLSGSHILVLVNGKRRHNSSLIDFNSGSVGRGANPVDMDLIPADAIKRIEILRDGAAAQYGSDAVAGVINIILKDNDDGGNLSASYGQREAYRGTIDGEVVTVGGSKGLKLGDKGSSTWAMQVKNAQKAVRNALNTYVNDYVYAGGLPETHSIYLTQNSVLPLEKFTLYSFASYADRTAKVGQNFRRPGTTSNVDSIFPDGFAPYYTMDEKDFEVSAGVKGETASAWAWDVSTVYGKDKVDHGSTNTVNASMGEDSPTTFRTYTSKFDQWTNNVDFTKAYYVDDHSFQVSWGIEHRYEQFVTEAGEEASYLNGGEVTSSGTPYAVGAQGAIIVTPDDEANADRNVAAIYAEVSTDVNDKWTVTAATRFEHYDDAGNVFSGKLNSRYDITDNFAVRGTVSNGFRAPSLSQANFGRTSTSFTLIGDTYEEIKSRLVKVDSDVAKALGAKDLKPEKTMDYSLGLTWEPFAGADITVDAYRIEIKDLVQLTSLMSGSGVAAILEDAGLATDTYVQYFTNAIDMTTQGVDVVSTYSQSLGDWGNLNYGIAGNYNENKIDSIADTPEVLQELDLTLFDRRSQGYIEAGTPKTKVILSLDWTMDAWSVSAKETRYGSFERWSNSGADYDEHYGAKWITDLSASYAFDLGLKVTLGANNLFNTYPDKLQASNPNGFAPYGANSPFGHYGAFYYLRANYSF